MYGLLPGGVEMDSSATQNSNGWKSRRAKIILWAMLALFLLCGQVVMGAEITRTTVTLSWTAPGDDSESGTATEYDLRYSESPITAQNWDLAQQADGEPQPQLAGSLERFTVTGLQPGTLYYFAIRAADEVPNWSVLSNVISVTTLTEDVPPAEIITLTSDQVTPTTVRLVWTAPGEDINVGIASAYDIRYAEAAIDETNWDEAVQVGGEPNPSPAGTVDTFTVTGLTPGIHYYFAIKTADAAGQWSDLSNLFSTTTGAETTPPETIADLVLDSVTENSAMLFWTAPGDDGDAGTASAYDIRYAAWPINISNWYAATAAVAPPDPQAAGNEQNFKITSLTTGVRYYFAIRTADEVPNWSGVSNVINAVARDYIIPGTVDDLIATTGANAGELALTWTAPGDDGATGTVSNYLIAYAADTLTAANWQLANVWPAPPTPLAAGETQTCLLTGLEQAQEYWVVVVAVDEANNFGELSNIASGESGFQFGTDVNDDPSGLPTEFSLGQNYPNPFNPATTIEYSLPSASEVRITVYNILGQAVIRLVDGQMPAGSYSVTWDGTDATGQAVASGVYLYTIETEDYQAGKKMILLQ